ncbi:non-canonical purine NTP pyrophosphatase, partial [Kocuria oceani]
MPEHDGARVVLATHNAGKLTELREMIAAALPGADVQRLVVDAAAAGAPDVVEDG